MVAHILKIIGDQGKFEYLALVKVTNQQASRGDCQWLRDPQVMEGCLNLVQTMKGYLLPLCLSDG